MAKFSIERVKSSKWTVAFLNILLSLFMTYICPLWKCPLCRVSVSKRFRSIFILPDSVGSITLWMEECSSIRLESDSEKKQYTPLTVAVNLIPLNLTNFLYRLAVIFLKLIKCLIFRKRKLLLVLKKV